MARPEQISTETILAALAAHPEAPAADLADVLGIGKSTAAKRLAAMECSGTVRRIPGGREAGVRVADRWAVSGSDGAEGVPDDETPGVEGASVPAGVGEGGRLGRGALRAMVLDYVKSQSGEVSPAQLSKTLGHSAGAISNVLAKLAGGADVVQTNESPRRYAAR